MKLFNKTKNMIRVWLDTTSMQKNIYYLNGTFSFEPDAVKNRIWMCGNPEGLDEFYKQLPRDNSYFWAASPHIKIRKIHSGLPALMVQVLTGIVIHDLNNIDVVSRQLDWDEISKNNKFDEISHKVIEDAPPIGDGAFRISFDTKLSKYLIIKFVSGDRVEIVCERERSVECVFKIEYKYTYKRYMLYEHCGKGYVKNILTEWGIDDPLPLSTIPQTAKLINVASAGYKLSDENGENEVMGHFAMAVPFKIKDSTKWENRGEDIFDKKTSPFDGPDKIISQWTDAVRVARTKQYIPDVLISHDPETGQMLAFNQYDDRFLMVEGNTQERNKNQIGVTQPVIPSKNYLQSYISLLDLRSQGVISPSTLGIDTKKVDNTEAQREKEKATSYIRNIITEAIQKTSPMLTNCVVEAYDECTKHSSGNDVEATASFGEYVSPSFEATVKTVAKARPGKAVMPVETLVDETYGDSKDKEWKAEEIKRLRTENGVMETQEPVISEFDDLGGKTLTSNDYPQDE